MSSERQSVYRQKFSVTFEYPVCFSRGILDLSNPTLANVFDRLGEKRRHRFLTCIDSGLIAAMPDIAARVANYFKHHSGACMPAGRPLTIPGGESAKRDRAAVPRIMRAIAAARLCRQSFVLAIGGGSFLDIAGLAAALAHRGLRLIRVPTTVLSQNDSGVGVKNGIDINGVKNFAGVFAPPFAVLVDGDFLSTLPDKYRIGGLAEAFKVAIIKDARFFRFLATNTARLRDRRDGLIDRAIRRCAELHLDHIRTAGDPFEFGAARPLDFGHWAAHRLEILSDYAIGHGQAVAIGIALDTHGAWKRGLLDAGERDAILKAMAAVGLPLYSPLMENKAADGQPELRRGLADFREHLGGRALITLPRGIGDRVEVPDPDWPTIAEGIDFLRRLTNSG